MTCPLKGYQIPCHSDYQGHHLINKGKTNKGSPAREDTCIKELIVDICVNHNWTKIADQPIPRKILTCYQISLYGEKRIWDLIDGIRWKIPNPALSFRGIMSAKLPDEWVQICSDWIKKGSMIDRIKYV